jgi:hypothetical protein
MENLSQDSRAVKRVILAPTFLPFEGQPRLACCTSVHLSHPADFSQPSVGTGAFHMEYPGMEYPNPHKQTKEPGKTFTYLLTPWHYSPDGYKPPLIGLILVYLRSRWLTCCHNTVSSQPDSTTRAIRQENVTGEKEVRKSGRQSISLMLCRVLLHAVNLGHGTDGFTSLPK